jgi:hypothetical protein
VKYSKVGLALFWIGAVYILAMGLGTSLLVKAAYRDLSLAQVNETPWALGGPLLGLWASAVPIGAILVSIGLLLFVRAKGSRVWLIGIGLFAVLLADILVKFRVLPMPSHWPPLFGVAGFLITVFFLGIVWSWTKRRISLDGTAQTAADLQLVGIVFLFTAMWYLCGDLSRPYQTALAELPLTSPVSTIVYLVLGWLFLYLSGAKSTRAIQE